MLGQWQFWLWAGANTNFWIDPAKHWLAFLMLQFMPSTRIRSQDFRNLTYQALVTRGANDAPNICYNTCRGAG
jgi:CubicO group peptidase (beta-lactamase class C family)